MNKIKKVVHEIITREVDHTSDNIRMVLDLVPDDLYDELSQHPDLLVKVVYIVAIAKTHRMNLDIPSKEILSWSAKDQTTYIVNYIEDTYKAVINR